MSIKTIIATFSLLPIVLIMRIISPFILIRLGRIRTDRIGHLAGNVDRHLCINNNNLERGNNKCIDLYYVYGNISNSALLDMWSRKLKITQGVIGTVLFAIDLVNSFFPGRDKYAIPELNYDQDNFNLVKHCLSHLEFNKKENEKGNLFLKSQGLTKNDNFICFCVRDSAYLSSEYPNIDFSYHDYRNANINTHVAAVNRFLDCDYGYKTGIRMGSIVESPIHENDKIIDYSLSGQRSDFLDLFLANKCRLFLNSGSGFSAIPRIFRTPMVSANVAPMGYIGSNPLVFIPKKYWHIKKKRFLTFKEILQSDIGYYLSSSNYIDNGIELVENTSDDIYHALLEADDRINGSWNPDEEDLYMQEKFQSLFLPDPRFPSSRTPISSHFLRSNIDLLVD